MKCGKNKWLSIQRNIDDSLIDDVKKVVYDTVGYRQGHEVLESISRPVDVLPFFHKGLLDDAVNKVG